MNRRVLESAEQSVHYLSRRDEGMPPAGRLPGSWSLDELEAQEGWCFELTPAEVDELRSALESMAALAVSREHLRLVAMDLPLLQHAAHRWRSSVDHGPGVVLVRGFPVAEIPLDRLKFLTAWLGWQFGDLGVQNPAGDVIGEIRNFGTSAEDPFVRNYATNREFRLHADAADRVGLLCLRTAATGGVNKVVSSQRVFEILREEAPELANMLFLPAPFDLRNEQPKDALPWAEIVPSCWTGENLSTLYLADYFRSVTRHEGVELSEERLQLYDAYEEIAERDEMSLEIRLEPGELLVLNNHLTLHARSAFSDASEGSYSDENGRLLLRFLASTFG